MRAVLSTLLLLLPIALLSCTEANDSLVGTDGLVLSGKGQNNGKGGGGGSNTSVMFSLSGGYETDPALQSAVFVNDNKRRMQIEGGGGCEGFGCKDIAITFAPDKIGACTPDQNPVDQATYDELYAQLSDPVQNRTFNASIEKNGAPVSEIRSIYHDGGTLEGQKYATRLQDASAAEGPKDTFTLTGGNVWILKDGYGQSLLCPFTGSLVLTVQR